MIDKCQLAEIKKDWLALLHGKVINYTIMINYNEMVQLCETLERTVHLLNGLKQDRETKLFLKEWNAE